jgi:YggT family protein
LPRNLSKNLTYSAFWLYPLFEIEALQAFSFGAGTEFLCRRAIYCNNAFFGESSNLMYFIGYFITTVAGLLYWVLTIYLYIIVAQAVLSWVNPDPYNPIVRFINNVTEPVLRRIRSRVPLYFGGLDFSPAIAILAIILLTNWIVPSLARLGKSLLLP